MTGTRPCRMIRVDMSCQTVTEGPAPAALERYGGRALTDHLLLHELPGRVDPRGPGNLLVIAPGLLAGFPISSAGRLSVGAKSPLTGGIKESSTGGVTGIMLARLGVKALVIQGEAPRGGAAPFILEVGATEARLVSAPDLREAGVYAAAAKLRERYGADCGLILVGPAGERGYAAACLCNTDTEGNPGRINGRGGLGSVMGLKGLKAIVVLPAPKDATAGELIDRPRLRGQYLAPARPEEFKAAVGEYTRLLRETPQTADVFPKLGTLANVERCSEIGCLPTRNFSAGTFEGASRIGGKPIRELILARGGEGTPTHTCMPGCLIRCSNKYPGPDGRTIVAPLEYETLALLGSNLGIDDPDVIAELNYACNDLGVDTIETGGAIGVCMEAGLAAFGDCEAVRRLLKEEAAGTVLGRLLGEGVAVSGRVLGVRRVPAVKGQGLPGYDPRALKGLGVTLAVSPQGADHTAGQTIRSAVDPHGVEGQVEASRRAQEQSAWYDSLGLCMFAGAAVGGRPELVAELVAASTGGEWTAEELWTLGREVLAAEREFNAREGFSAADDRLPQFFYDEPLGPKGLRFDVPLDKGRS